MEYIASAKPRLLTTRLLVTTALLVSTAVGVGAGVLVSQVAAPDKGGKDVKSITGVSSGVDGSGEKQPEKKGVDQVAIPPEPPATVEPASETDTDPDGAGSQAVTIEGVEGTEGVMTERENTIEIFSANDGTMQSIRGIKGIDTVMLQNLEAVLRMQAPPPPPEEGGGGGTRAAAALLTMETDEPPDPEEEVDGREELTELELEGS
jgi:hypothetical protein